MSAGSGATKRAINLPRPAFWTRPAHFLSPDRDPSAGPLPPPHRDAALTQIVRSSCGPSGMRPAFVLPLHIPIGMRPVPIGDWTQPRRLVGGGGSVPTSASTRAPWRGRLGEPHQPSRPTRASLPRHRWPIGASPRPGGSHHLGSNGTPATPPAAGGDQPLRAAHPAPGSPRIQPSVSPSAAILRRLAWQRPRRPQEIILAAAAET